MRFRDAAEAHLVDILRQQTRPFISLVAERDRTVVGHILFTPVSLRDTVEVRMMGLAPMAVLPAFQRSGIGSALVRAGLEECRRHGFSAVVVLGRPKFYTRFGLVSSFRFDIRSEYAVREEAFMAVELEAGSLSSASDMVEYHEAFKNL